MPVLLHVLDTSLRLLHPYMPYVTEEIWSGSGELRRHLSQETPEMLMVAPYPQADAAWRDEEAEKELGLVLDVVRAVRNLRRERNLDAARWLEAYVVGGDALGRHSAAIETLARVRPLRIVSDRSDAPSESVASAILSDAQVILPLAGLFDVEAERTKLQKDLEQAQKQVEGLERQLTNEKFLSSAPAKVVEEARERLEAARSRQQGLEARLAELG